MEAMLATGLVDDEEETVDPVKLQTELEQLKSRIESFRLDPKSVTLSDRERSCLGSSAPPKRFRKIVTTRHWREFTAETVVLARIPKRSLTDRDRLQLDLYVDHRGGERIDGATIYLNIYDSHESIVKHDHVPVGTVQPKSVARVGTYRLELATADYLEAPTTLKIEILFRFPGPRNPDCPNSNRYSVPVRKTND